MAPSNPLITDKALDASLSVQLHPLVLLTVSDYITRHTLRSPSGPIVGAIIGQQRGRSYTLEHAFECKLADTAKDTVQLDSDWFQQRLEQYIDVHKEPALDLIGIFVTGPVDGPQVAHLPVVRQVLQSTAAETLMLLMFHGTIVDQLQGGKLPISLYETVIEPERDELKFRELSFEVETGEAEMIGVDFVAKGGGNATAVPNADAATLVAEPGKKERGRLRSRGKEKDKEKEAEVEADGKTDILSPEDEELIASLTAKANAVKMLNQRVNLIRQYLETLPPSYLTDPSSPTAPTDSTHHTLLRSINALLSRIPLLAPPTLSTSTSATYDEASPVSTLLAAGEKERQDVHLTTLLAALTRSVSEAQGMGAKFHVLQRERQNKERSGGFGRGGGGRGGGGTYGEDFPLGESGVY